MAFVTTFKLTYTQQLCKDHCAAMNLLRKSGRRELGKENVSLTEILTRIIPFYALFSLFFYKFVWLAPLVLLTFIPAITDIISSPGILKNDAAMLLSEIWSGMLLVAPVVLILWSFPGLGLRRRWGWICYLVAVLIQCYFQFSYFDLLKDLQNPIEISYLIYLLGAFALLFLTRRSYFH